MSKYELKCSYKRRKNIPDIESTHPCADPQLLHFKLLARMTTVQRNKNFLKWNTDKLFFPSSILHNILGELSKRTEKN